MGVYESQPCSGLDGVGLRRAPLTHEESAHQPNPMPCVRQELDALCVQDTRVTTKHSGFYIQKGALAVVQVRAFGRLLTRGAERHSSAPAFCGEASSNGLWDSRAALSM